jgi:Zn-dependent protease with chaperone function
MNIPGRYFDGQTSAATAVDVQLLERGALVLTAPGLSRSAEFKEVEVSERIGNMMRRIHFPDGASCELLDNDAVDAWVTRAGARPRLQYVFWLERRWPYALASLIVLTAFSWAFIQFGVPVLAKKVLALVPPGLDQTLGKGTLSALDQVYVKPTALSAARQKELHEIFSSVVADQPNPEHYRLELRRGQSIGPNALALPDGVIVLTDELAELSENPDELRAVFAHEVGHVVHRHGMLTVLQTSGIGVLLFALFADVSSISHLVAGAPAVLATAKYSRSLEREADDYSFAYLKRHGISAHVMASLLARVEKKLGTSEGGMGYLATHPPTKERDRRQ